VTDKRRNLLILGLVLCLMGVTAALVVARDFRLGLDLRGGIEIVLEARPDEGETVTSDVLSQSSDILRKRIDPQGVLSPEIRTSESDSTVTVAVPGIKDPQDAAELLVSSGQLQSFDLYKYLNSASSSGQFEAVPANSLYDLLNKAKSQVEDESNVDGWALFDKSTKKHYGFVEPTQEQVLKDLEGKPQPAASDRLWLAVPEGTEVVSCQADNGCPGVAATNGSFYYLFDLKRDEKGNPDVITGDQVSAKATTDENGQPAVELAYKNGGADEFTDISRDLAIAGAAVGTPLPNAIVVDGELVASPIVDFQQFPQGIDASVSGSSLITGVSRDEAERIALEVQSGSLPVQFVPVSTTVIGASLGSDSLRNGLIAGAAGLVFVMIFLLIFYGFLGLIADIALLIYGVLLAGVVLAIPVTLTLPGIAGMILTIGVAADANIVIFERIKEEVRAGKTIRTAIATGYSKGFKTIIDANVVTLITAFVLYVSTTSSVKGFALMLLIGVITSIFTAVVATRAMLSLLAGMRFMSSPRVLGSVGTGDRWKKYDLIGKWRIWFATSFVLICVSVFALVSNGLNEGIDFTGGSRIEFQTPQPHETSDVTTVLEDAGVPDPEVVSTGDQADDGGYTGFRAQSEQLRQAQQDAAISAISQEFDVSQDEITVRNVSSSFGSSVLDSAYLAIAFSLLVIFIYITFRFEWRFAVPVMVALAHDIIITLGFYALVQREVTADTVAAVLTVLGYSLYDTVIVFDRVRENIPLLRRMTASRIVNESLAEVITRSLNTSLVTLIPVILLFTFGTGTLQDFAFALIVGIASGAYSSIFVAAPLLALLLEREPAFVRRREEIERGGGEPEPSRSPRSRTPAPAAPSAPAPAMEGPPTAVADGERQRRRRRRRHGRR
jgi:SecD/SecF fusion protein